MSVLEALEKSYRFLCVIQSPKYILAPEKEQRRMIAEHDKRELERKVKK